VKKEKSGATVTKGREKVVKENEGKGQALTARRVAKLIMNGGRRTPLPAPRRKMTHQKRKQKRRD